MLQQQYDKSFFYNSNEKYKVGLINVIFPEDGTLKESRHDFFINGMFFSRILKHSRTWRVVLVVCVANPLHPSRVASSTFPRDPSRPFPGNGMKTIDFIPYIKQSGELIPLTRSLLVTLFPSVPCPLSLLGTPNGFSINFFLARTLIRFQTNLRWRISLLEDSDCCLLLL